MGTPSGKGLYLTVYPSSCPNMDTVSYVQLVVLLDPKIALLCSLCSYCSLYLQHAYGCAASKKVGKYRMKCTALQQPKYVRAGESSILNV